MYFQQINGLRNLAPYATSHTKRLNDEKLDMHVTLSPLNVTTRNLVHIHYWLMSIAGYKQALIA